MNGASVGYHLRTNKAVERKIFFELINLIKSHNQGAGYTYIGFGGPMMEDFREAHHASNFEDLISIESNSSTYERQQFNKPFGFVNCVNKTSGEFINTFSSVKNTVFWLDYTSAKDLGNQLSDVERLIKKLKPMDILKVTVNANPDTIYRASSSELEEQEEQDDPNFINKRILSKLETELGEDYFPVMAAPDQVTTKNYPKFIAGVLDLAFSRAVATDSGKCIFPLSRFFYTDHTHQMYTCTALITGTEEPLDIISTMKEWSFFSESLDDIFEIKVPALTMKEKIEIDAMLEGAQLADQIENIAKIIKLETNKKQSKKLIENYITYYKYYPTFQRLAI